MENTDIRIAMEAFASRETSLLPTTSAKAAFLLSEANQTLSHLWFRLASQATEEAVSLAAKTYRAERLRLERNQLNKQADGAKLAAQPELNPCPHVHELEVIMNVRNDARRMKLLRRFVDRMKSGIQDNWIVCGKCDKHLICKHEILLMEEYNHPGRGDKLHKSLLLDFAAPIVFEGAYICKNCGQKISELEYDTHMEYDDDGKPMVGRTVIEEEGEGAAAAAAAAAAETTAADNVTEDDELPIVLSEGTKEYDETHMLIRTIVEYSGIIATPEVMNRIMAAVAGAYSTIMNETTYEKVIKMLKPKQQEAYIQMNGEYPQYYDTSKIIICTAFVILEILTQKTPVSFPAVGCKFGRGGYPLTPYKEGEDGIYQYVCCVVASINKNAAPWSHATWITKTDLNVRRALVMKKVKDTLDGVMAKASSSTAVESYKIALTTLTEGLADGVVQKNIPSTRDQIPLQFRPIPNPDITELTSENAIQNEKTFQKDLESAPVSEIAPYIKLRQQQILQRGIKSLHTTSAEYLKGTLSETSARSDSSCCFKRLGAVAITGTGLGSMQSQNAIREMELLENAEATVRRRDPAASCSGTHIMVPWSAPAYTSEMASSDSDTYYRLFLKHCFRGVNMGLVHEFDVHVTTRSETIRGHRCRYCDFIYPEALTWLTLANISESNARKLEAISAELVTKRKEISLQAFMEQQVVINEQTFRELEDRIRMRKAVVAPAVAASPHILSDLEGMHAILADAPVLPNASAEFLKFVEIMRDLFHTTDNREDSFARFIPLYNGMNAYFESTLQHYQIESIGDVLTGFAAMTNDMMGAQAARNVLNVIVVQAEKISNNGYVPGVVPTKWIPKISGDHMEQILRIWDNESEFVRTLSTAMVNLPVVSKDLIRDMLKKFSGWFGEWVQVWINSLRIAPNFTEVESRYLLRWSVLTAFASLTNPLSPLLNTATEPVRKVVIPFMVRMFSDMIRRYGYYNAGYLMTSKQIDDAIHDRREQEKRLFIKHFDDLDTEMRKVELINKKLGLGFFAEAKVRQGHYDANIYDIETARMAEMGIEDFTRRLDRQQRETDIGNDHRDRADEDQA